MCQIDPGYSEISRHEESVLRNLYTVVSHPIPRGCDLSGYRFNPGGCRVCFNEVADNQHTDLVPSTQKFGRFDRGKNNKNINQWLVLFRVLHPILTQNFGYFFPSCV